MTDNPPTPPARYDGYADWYDANFGPYIEAAGRDLLALLGSGPGRCLDLGCGTGVNLRRLSDAGWSVIGVDLSSDQLRRARARAPDPPFAAPSPYPASAQDEDAAWYGSPQLWTMMALDGGVWELPQLTEETWWWSGDWDSGSE